VGIRNLINDNELRVAVDLINRSKIPSPPQLLLDLRKQLALENPDIKTVSSLVAKDIGLSAQVIKALNSPLYGLKIEITSIEHAISMFGMQKLKDIIVQPAYRKALDDTIEGFEDISENSHSVGLIAELIGNEVENNMHGIFYLAGLFHDVGALVMALHYSDYKEMYEQFTLHPITFPLLEREKYQVSHTAIGVLLAKKWGLANTVCNAIYLHHHLYATYRKELSAEDVTMASVLKLAQYYNYKNLQFLDVEGSVECNLIHNNAVGELMLEEQSLHRIEEDVFSLNP